MIEHVFDQKVPDLTEADPWGGEPKPLPVHNHEERIELLLYSLVLAVQANTAATALPAVKRYYGDDSDVDREWSGVLA